MNSNNFVRMLQDMLARVVAAREELGAGCDADARFILSDLEHDLAAAVQELEEPGA